MNMVRRQVVALEQRLGAHTQPRDENLKQPRHVLVFSNGIASWLSKKTITCGCFEMRMWTDAPNSWSSSPPDA